MRNLKRALSLTLASVMLLGMMVVGSSAAAGYSDVDENDNVEAIEVLQAVEVMVGDDRGFGPDRPVTRNEMAVVMGKLLNLDYNYYTSTCPFTDVADWARGWVGACAANGIVSGRGNGIYDGESTVTAIEAASMMMRALGYFKNLEDYADGFQVVTVRQGSQIGIFNNVGTDANTPMTRNQVAQMALNALRSNMVDFTGTPGIDVNGVKVGYRAEYTFRSGTDRKYFAISGQGNTTDGTTNQAYIQLGEELYDGDLKLYDHARDPFYRPARVWEYDGKEIGTYAKKELIREEYTTEVTGRMLYDRLGSTVLEDNRYSVDIAIDGERDKDVLDGFGYFTKGNIVRGNTKKVGETGNGVLTEVYVDTENYEITIAIINTYLAVVDGDYNEKKDELDLDIYAIDDKGSGTVAYVKDNSAGKVEDETVSGEDFDIANYKDEDIVLVTVAKAEVQSIADPDVIAGTKISGFKTGDWLEADGSQKDYATTALWDEAALTHYTGNYGDGSTNLKDTTYNVYLDKYGYVIGLEEVDPEDHYVFITGIDSNASNLGVRVADANAIFLDGTMQTIKVDVRESTAVVSNRDGTSGVKNAYPTGDTAEYNAAIVNHWFTYSVGDDGVYTLKDIATQTTEDAVSGDITIDKKHITRTKSPAETGYAVGNADTVYINTKSLAGVNLRVDNTSGTIIDDVDTVTVGSQNVNLTVKNTLVKGTSASNFSPKAEIYTLWNSDNWIIGVVTIDAEDEGVSSNYAYVTSGSVKSERYDESTKLWTWVREVVINGKKTDITYTSDKRIGILDNGNGDGWFTGTAAADMDMDRGYWYKINYKADGTVKDIVPLAKYFIHSETSYWDDSADEYIDHTAEIEMTYDDDDPDVAILWMKGGQNAADHTSPNRITYNEKGSVYTYVGDQTGFSISPDVKVVVANAGGKNATPFDSVVDTYEGEKGLKDAISDLNANKPFVGDVSAILEGGVATSIIFNCTAPDPSFNGGQETPVLTGAYSSEVDQTITTGLDKLDLTKTANNRIVGGKLKLNVYGGGDVEQQIKDALAAQGYTIAAMEVTSDDGTDFEYTIVISKDGVTRTVTCLTVDGTSSSPDVTTYWKLNNNGTKSYVTNGTNATIASTGQTGTGFQAQEADGTKTYVQYGNNHSVDQDVTLEPSYVSFATATITANATGSCADLTGTPKATIGSAQAGTAGVKVGSTVTLTVTIGATVASPRTATITLTPAVSTGAVAAPAAKVYQTTDTVTAGQEIDFTFTVGTANITGVTLSAT